MSRTSIYLNFERNTEEAFNFYRSVFGTEFLSPIDRFGSLPVMKGQPTVREEDKNLVMNVQLPILGGAVLMGTDAPESMGFNLKKGNNYYINLEPDTLEETESLFAKLSTGGIIKEPLKKEFWGVYGSCVDQFGVQWMFNFYEIEK